MQAQQSFHDLEEGRIQLDAASLQATWLNHPQGCMGFRLETRDGVIVYATDNEPGHALFDKNVRKLAAGADVLSTTPNICRKNMRPAGAAGDIATGGKPSTW